MWERTATAVVVWVLLSASPAHGWEQMNEQLRWACEPIGVYVGIDGWPGKVAEKVVRRLDEASPLEFVLVESPVGAKVTVSYGDPGRGNGAVAVMYGTESEYVKAEVILSPYLERRWVASTLHHEFGHVAGLDHSDTRSVMNLTEVPWKNFQKDDLRGLAEMECR